MSYRFQLIVSGCLLCVGCAGETGVAVDASVAETSMVETSIAEANVDAPATNVPQTDAAIDARETSISIPQDVGADTFEGGVRVAQVAVGGNHTCARYTDGTLRCWGLNSQGQLGDGTLQNRNVPTRVVGLDALQAVEIVAGEAHTCARFSDASVRCWGTRVGMPEERQNSPSEVPELAQQNIRQLSSGLRHVCALLVDGAILCWGDNREGQVSGGVGDTVATWVTQPRRIEALQNQVAVDVRAGVYNTCARFADQSLRCWGSSSFGALGHGTTTPSSTPVAVTGISGLVPESLSVGRWQACATFSDGSLRCWGLNTVGRLGDETTIDRSVPTLVHWLHTTVTASASGYLATCAVFVDGLVRCWGKNGWGVFGDGTSTDSPQPRTVQGLNGLQAVEIGMSPLLSSRHHSCARFADGSLRCWGYNEFGQLGDGTLSTRIVPIVVGLP